MPHRPQWDWTYGTKGKLYLYFFQNFIFETKLLFCFPSSLGTLYKGCQQCCKECFLKSVMSSGGQFLHQHDSYFFSILKVKLLMERKVAFSCTTKCCQLSVTILESSDRWSNWPCCVETCTQYIEGLLENMLLKDVPVNPCLKVTLDIWNWR